MATGVAPFLSLRYNTAKEDTTIMPQTDEVNLYAEKT